MCVSTLYEFDRQRTLHPSVTAPFWQHFESTKARFPMTPHTSCPNDPTPRFTKQVSPKGMTDYCET